MRVKPPRPPRAPVSQEQHGTADDAANSGRRMWDLFGFLKRLEMSFESFAILVLSLEFGLQLLDEKLETSDFIAQLLHVC
jgi:hypothetical protein